MNILAKKPDAVVFYWDSDCSNENNYELTPKQEEYTRGNYTVALNWLIDTIKSSGAHLMIAGPGSTSHRHSLVRSYA